MSLPPGFLDELRSRLSLAQVVGRKVMWDSRKSNQAKGDMWAPCPFHQEKTASFHVDDRKGFYYCFGCHAKGDAISFVRESENLGFMEAVEVLAREAGMQMPARDPRAQEKADHLTRLREVMEAAVRHYRMQLATGAAAEAREYLVRRGLDEDTLARFEIGYAPEARRGLYEALRGRGVEEAMIVEAGLAAQPDDGGAAYDRFRGRIVFPIRDGQGRAIGLGGRAMRADARAKYLNSPATPLFDKSRSLYNLAPAREAAGKGQPLIVAEGYMDVIALVRAGFEAAVAPLGTAITEEQLDLLWRMADEPLIALDGDRAGLSAAHRLIDLTLPRLTAGKGLRFVLMPPGQDPDDLLRAGGPAAMQKLIDGALPMVQLLWQRETEGRILTEPDQRAALEADLAAHIAAINDKNIRFHYDRKLKDLAFQTFRALDGAARKRGRKAGALDGPRLSTQRSLLSAASSDSTMERCQEEAILSALLLHPSLAAEVEARLESLEWSEPEHATLAGVILSHQEASPDALRQHVRDILGEAPLERLDSLDHLAVMPFRRRPGDRDSARLALVSALERLEAEQGHRMELSEAEEDIAGLATETLTWRLRDAAEARHRAGRAMQEDRTDYDIAENGARISRQEREAMLKMLADLGLSDPER
ncbi:DNA primase [Rhodosalinus halophilus]|uniref:DNA primase n=1 Tax=Rhodosalinus halophilus TaxID=2259333 RepID=A0A365U5N3_9RHOB|nr:DNA primase [Rhodosalinus halophilus]RBI82793.1 DNA primase [Rhodosalinus halophilus]